MKKPLELPVEIAALIDDEAARHGQEPAEYVRALVEERARSRSANGRGGGAPPPERMIVTGTLEQLTASKRTFRLLLPSGERLRGVLPPGDAEQFAPLLGKKVLVDGVARFRRSRAVAAITARHMRAATEKDILWERAPKPRPRTLADLQPGILPPPGSNGMEFVFGQWPGDESTEELLAALKTID